VRLHALHSSVCYADKEASCSLFLARKSKRFPEQAYVVHSEERCECWTDLSCLESGGSPGGLGRGSRILDPTSKILRY
jgi:hypothetical protein